MVMNDLIKNFSSEAARLQNSNPTRQSLNDFIFRLKALIGQINQQESRNDIRAQLYSIESFKSFDELTWLNKVLQLFNILRYRSDYFNNWNGQGKFQYDFDTLIIKLDALLFSLERYQ
jgi:hypothetical protein